MANIGVAITVSKFLSDFLNTKIDAITVFDEMFLIEHGMSGNDKTLNLYIKKIMVDNMKPKNKKNKRE